MENNKLSNLYFNKIMKHIDKLSKEMDLYYKFKNNIILPQIGGSVMLTQRLPIFFNTKPLQLARETILGPSPVTAPVTPSVTDFKVCITNYNTFLERYIEQQQSVILVTQLQILNETLNHLIDVITKDASAKLIELITTGSAKREEPNVEESNVEGKVEKESQDEKMYNAKDSIYTAKSTKVEEYLNIINTAFQDILKYMKDTETNKNGLFDTDTTTYNNYINGMLNKELPISDIYHTTNLSDTIKDTMLSIITYINTYFTKYSANTKQNNPDISSILTNVINNIIINSEVSNNNTTYAYILHNSLIDNNIPEGPSNINRNNLMHLLGLVPYKIIYNMKIPLNTLKLISSEIVEDTPDIIKNEALAKYYSIDTGKLVIADNGVINNYNLDIYKTLISDIINNYDQYVMYLYHMRHCMMYYKIGVGADTLASS